MKTKFLFWKILIIGVLVAMPCKAVNSEVKFSDCLSLTGFTRYEFGIHTGESNPNLAENHKLTLSKFFLQTEWTYQPTNVFKVFANLRALGDTTSLWDSKLHNYNAFPVDVPKYDWTMMKASEDHFRAEVWELYADVTIGDLWLRLGRQQTAWGEMIGARILDVINPLDLSWNMTNEPEEFELCRIPEWTIRGIYNLSSSLPGWITNPTIEGFVIPGDVYPNFTADRGAPFFLVNLPPFFKINEKDRRGDPEWGVRLGAGAAGFYGTLNFLRLYAQDFSLKFRGFAPDPIFGIPFFAPLGDFTPYSMLLDAEYPSITIFGMSLNYAFAHPYNLVVSFETTWIPNQPWGDAQSATPAIQDQGKWVYALNLTRNTWVWPQKFLAPSMMMGTLELIETVVEGDVDNILGPGNSKVHKSMEWWVLQLQQPLLHNTLTPVIQFIYDSRDAHLIKPSIKYNYGDHWYFDVWATFYGGSCKNAYDIFGNSYWQDTVYGRVTYQF